MSSRSAMPPPLPRGQRQPEQQPQPQPQPQKTGRAISRKDTTLVYGQIRATLQNNRVLYATSIKSILAARYVLEQTPEVWASRLRVQADATKRVDATRSANPSSTENQQRLDPGVGDENIAADASCDAAAYEAEQTETRTWVCECLNRVLGILLDQIPLRVEARYQEIISFCLIESTYGK